MSHGNPYQTPQTSWNSYAPFAADAKAEERAAFIQRTYLHLLGAVVAFVLLETALFTLVPQQTLEQAVFHMFGRWSWLLILGGFMFVSWIARSWASSSASQPLQYAGLALYVVAQAILFMPLLFVALYYTGGLSAGTTILTQAALLTLFIFGGLTVITFITKADFSYLGTYLWWGGLAAMGIIVIGLLMGFSLGFWFMAAMVLLASGYILYDTSNVLHRYQTNQHVAAALALFASVALLFWYVLQILMIMNRR